MLTVGHNDNSVGERKLIWDEENRLFSVDENGLATPVFGCIRHRSSGLDTLLSLARKVMSNYWYDADGEGFCCNDGTLEAAQAKASWKSQIFSTTPNGTNFYKINGIQIFNENGTKK